MQSTGFRLAHAVDKLLLLKYGISVPIQPRYTVLVVNQNAMLLNGIVLLIRAQVDLEVAGVTQDASEADSLFAQLQPDVTLMDLDLPAGVGVTAIRRIRTLDADAKIIGLATYELDEAGLEALSLGAVALLAKDQISDALVPLIREWAKRVPPRSNPPI